jgi:hypothetical protein
MKLIVEEMNSTTLPVLSDSLIKHYFFIAVKAFEISPS